MPANEDRREPVLASDLTEKAKRSDQEHVRPIGPPARELGEQIARAFQPLAEAYQQSVERLQRAVPQLSQLPDIPSHRPQAVDPALDVAPWELYPMPAEQRSVISRYIRRQVRAQVIQELRSILAQVEESGQ